MAGDDLALRVSPYGINSKINPVSGVWLYSGKQAVLVAHRYDDVDLSASLRPAQVK